jgi:transitional endoplasmic reticulum ATPase
MAKISQDEKNRNAVMATLEKLGGMTVGDDSLIFEGSRFILPKNMEGDINGAIRYLLGYQQQQEESFNFSREFKYRPNDGANAFQNAMIRLFGTAGIGGTIQTLFGEIKPEYRTINVSPTETVQVPWNRVNFSPLQASFYLGATRTREHGVVFQLQVEAPRKYRKHIEAFFTIVEDELAKNSIFRGKAFTGGEEPQFIDLTKVDRSKVVYSQSVQTQLDTNMWSLLRHSQEMREQGVSLKRAVLVEGPYGTGKTLAGMLTAQEAVQNGWTFIIARPGQDNVEDVLKTAQLYAPAVVWYEDIDNIAEGDNKLQISKLLDTLDGAQSKGYEVLAGFTTNHVKKLQKGVLRPGRLDAVIHVEGLDAKGFEQLIKVTLGEMLGEVDYTKVAEAFEGFLPAFATEAIQRAKMYSISRNGGTPDLINTDDLVNSAEGLRDQLVLMEDAKEGATQPTLDSALKIAITDVVKRTQLVDSDGDPRGFYSQVVPEGVKLPGSTN